MTGVEFLRIVSYIRDHPDKTAKLLAQDKNIPDWPVTQYCQFRDTEQNRCGIYPVRPVICRLFGHTEWLPCPLDLVPLKGQDAMAAYQRYAQDDLRTFDEWRAIQSITD